MPVESIVVPAQPKIVIMGGGHGPSSLRQGLKERTPHILAVVPVVDSEGSGGKIRRLFGMIPPGDLTNAMADLAKDPIDADFLRLRFNRGQSLTAHRASNIVFAAATEMFNGDVVAASDYVGDKFGIIGKVRPICLEAHDIRGHSQSGRRLTKEHHWDGIEEDGPVEQLSLSKKNVKALDEVIKGIYESDFITLGPGTLAPNVLSQLLIPEVSEAICNSQAVKELYINIANRNGERGYRASDYAERVAERLGCKIDCAVYPRIPQVPLDHTVEKKYEDHDQDLVALDQDRLLQFVHRVRSYALVHVETIRDQGKKKQVFRHFPEASADAAFSVWREVLSERLAV